MGKRTSALALIACVCVALPASATTRYLLAIGAREGLKSEAPLQWAERDAERVRDVFVDIGGVHHSRAQLLRAPTPGDLERALVRLGGNIEEAQRRGERTELIVHYAGHGDHEALHLAGARYPLTALRDRLAEIPASATVVVIDACRTSGSARGAKVGPGFSGSILKTLAPKGTVILFSAKAGEVAQESDALEGAFFTHAFLAGLRGAADLDDDDRVTLAEAWQATHARTLARTHASARAQHPEIELALAGEGEIVLTELKRAEAQLVLSKDIVGSVLVLEARTGRVLLEVDKQDAGSARLALPAARYVVQVRGARETRRGEVDLSWGGTRVVQLSHLDKREALAAAARGGAQVDATPWQGTVSGGAFASDYGRPGITGRATLSRRLFELPIFIGGGIEAGAGRRQSDLWIIDHTIGGLSLVATSELYVGDARLTLGLDLSALVVSQRGERVDKARLERVLGSSPTLSERAITPNVHARVGVSVPLAFGLRWLVLGRVGGGLLPRDDQLRPSATADLQIGLGWEM